MAASMASGNIALTPSEFMISFINSHFDDNVRSLSKLQDVYKDVKDQRSAIESRVNESRYLFHFEHKPFTDSRWSTVQDRTLRTVLSVDRKTESIKNELPAAAFTHMLNNS